MGRVFFRLPEEISDHDLREQINIFLDVQELDESVSWEKVKRRAITFDRSEFAVVQDIARSNETTLNCAMDLIAIRMLQKQVKALKEGLSTFQIEELKKKTDYYDRMLKVYRKSMLNFERQQDKFFKLLKNKEDLYDEDLEDVEDDEEWLRK